MATYRSVASTETDPQAPVTSALMKALEANPTAIAEGASGAPKVMGIALGGVYFGSGSASGSINTLNLDNAKTVRFDLGVSQTGSATRILQFSFSNDNGSSWGSAQNSVTVNFNNEDTGTGVFVVDLETGDWSGYLTADDFGSGSGTFTVPADCNAVRVGWNSSVSSWRLFSTCIGGRS